MEPQWFYQNDGRKGPVETTELIRALQQLPNPRQVKLWREGLPEWIDAGTVSEIAGKLPPPVLGAPPASAARFVSASAFPASEPSSQLRAVEAIARNYRTLVLLVGLQILLGVFLQLVAEPLLALALLVALLAVAVAMAISAYKLMSGLEAGSPILWAVGIFVPLINLLVVAAISSRAQTWCKRCGIKVGLLGPTASSLAEFRQRVSGGSVFSS
jgi:hypothetical protein